MSIPHVMASGMGGIRTAGDLVSRMEFTKNMNIDQAKEYVPKKLGLDVESIANVQVMREVREELGLGLVTSMPSCARGMEAKMNIEDVLGVKINCCEKFRQKTQKR